MTHTTKEGSRYNEQMMGMMKSFMQNSDKSTAKVGVKLARKIRAVFPRGQVINTIK